MWRPEGWQEHVNKQFYTNASCVPRTYFEMGADRLLLFMKDGVQRGGWEYLEELGRSLLEDTPIPEEGP